jgi:hypothetical protein
MAARLEAIQAEIKTDLEEMPAKIDTNLKEMNEQMRARLKAKIEDNNEKFEVLCCTVVSRMDAHQERMMACLGQMEATDLEVNSTELESLAEHQEVPKEHAALKSSGSLKKRHRGCHLAAGRCGKPKELT